MAEAPFYFFADADLRSVGFFSHGEPQSRLLEAVRVALGAEIATSGRHYVENAAGEVDVDEEHVTLHRCDASYLFVLDVDGSATLHLEPAPLAEREGIIRDLAAHPEIQPGL